MSHGPLCERVCARPRPRGSERARSKMRTNTCMHTGNGRYARLRQRSPTKKKTWVRVVRVVGEVRRRGPRPGRMEGMAGAHAMRPCHLRSGVEARGWWVVRWWVVRYSSVDPVGRCGGWVLVILGVCYILRLYYGYIASRCPRTPWSLVPKPHLSQAWQPRWCLKRTCLTQPRTCESLFCKPSLFLCARGCNPSPVSARAYGGGS